MDDASRSGHARSKLIALLAMCALACGGFIALGVWQLHRLSWKLDLIARVETRIHAAPIPAPVRSAWPQVDAAHDEYLRVSLQGHYLDDRDTRVQALTAMGGGFWVLSPLQLADGSIVLINRGFIPSDFHGKLPAESATRVAGLLRLSEPGGGFLRRNDPAHERWYSRDVAAIAAARGLRDVAPFFIDAEADAALPPTWPRAGLTVTHFANNHLGYALTWFALALLAAAAAGWLVWEEAGEPRSHTR